MRWDTTILDDTEKITLGLRALYRQYGFLRYRTEKFEEYDLYAQNKDFLISKNVITFTDTDGKLMALKPDVTLSVVKNLRDAPEEQRKLCYNETVYRVSKGTGTFRELKQTGLECIGRVDTAAVGEVLLLAAKSLELCAGSYMMVISNLDILTRLLQEALPDPELHSEALGCIEGKNAAGVAALCRRAGTAPEKAGALVELTQLFGSPGQVMPRLRELCKGRELSGACAELEAVLRILRDNGFEERVRLDFSSVGNPNYYNGILFKGFVEGLPDSVLSGGRYDGLMRRMGKKSRAVGFAVYLDRLERLGRSGNGGVVFQND